MLFRSGGQNLFLQKIRTAARGSVCENGEIKRVIKKSASRRCYICPQNQITSADAEVQDPVREEKRLRSGRKPKAEIPAGADWRFWIFPRSRVSTCLSPMISVRRTAGRKYAPGIRDLRRNLGVAEENRLRIQNISATLGTVRHVLSPMDSVRRNDQPHGVSIQTSHHGKADPLSVYQYRNQLHESGGAPVE